MGSFESTAGVERWLEEATTRLVREIDPESVILFGAFSRGTATRRSDVDLCVIWETVSSPLERIGAILSILRDAPRPVDAVSYTPEELARLDTPFIRRILKEGKVLYERGTIAA